MPWFLFHHYGATTTSVHSTHKKLTGSKPATGYWQWLAASCGDLLPTHLLKWVTRKSVYPALKGPETTVPITGIDNRGDGVASKLYRNTHQSKPTSPATPAFVFNMNTAPALMHKFITSSSLLSYAYIFFWSKLTLKMPGEIVMTNN